MVKRKGLGRGLDALLAGSTSSELLHGANDGELRELPLDRIQRGKYQPRKHMDGQALQDLAQSIRARGVVQPIVVRLRDGGPDYEIIAGERRWRAAQLAECEHIPAVIRDVPDDAALAIALIENIQREDLNAMEEARALRRLIDEFEMTHQQAAEAVGWSRAAVSNLLRLLDLDAGVAQMLEDGQLDMGHGRALLGLEPGAQLATAKDVVRRGLSARATEALVRHLKSAGVGKADKDRPSSTGDADIRRLQDGLSGRLGAKVSIQHRAKGNGRLIIDYGSVDELEGILGHID